MVLQDLLHGLLQSGQAGEAQGLARMQQLPQRQQPLPQPFTPPAPPSDTTPDAQSQLLQNGMGILASGNQPQAQQGFNIQTPQGTTADAYTGNALAPGDPSLGSFKGVTLQDAALQSLIQIARQSDVLPGLRELNQIGSSYRTPDQQAALLASKAAGNHPGPVAPQGQSYHQEGLAFDGSFWNNPQLAAALKAAGWYDGSNFGDYGHWSYGSLG